MRKAIFLDRDGTINVEKHYLYKIEEFEFLSGVLEGLKLLQDAGYLLVVVTNQSGIARGYYSEADFKKLNDWMLEKLSQEGINIASVYYCPHLPDAQVMEYRQDCDCRKPKLGMFHKAIEELGIDIDRSYAIGDMLRDLEIARETQCKGILVGNRESSENIRRIKAGEQEKISYADNLKSAALEILRNSK